MSFVNDLARTISILRKDFANIQADENCPESRLVVEGATRDLSPLVRDDVFRIVSAALQYSFEHARARWIEVEVCYGPGELRVRIGDNGKGIDPRILEEGGRGLLAIKQRAKLLGGNLTVWSKVDRGTETELIIPASVAYAKSDSGRSRFWTKGA